MPKEALCFGRMTATRIVRLDAGKDPRVVVAELLAATEYPQIALWIQFPTALPLFLLVTSFATVGVAGRKGLAHPDRLFLRPFPRRQWRTGWDASRRGVYDGLVAPGGTCPDASSRRGLGRIGSPAPSVLKSDADSACRVGATQAGEELCLSALLSGKYNINRRPLISRLPVVAKGGMAGCEEIQHDTPFFSSILGKCFQK